MPRPSADVGGRRLPGVSWGIHVCGLAVRDGSAVPRSWPHGAVHSGVSVARGLAGAYRVSAASFTVKQLRVTLILTGSNAVFPGTNSNTLVLEGLRMSAQVQSVARLATQCDIRI